MASEPTRGDARVPLLASRVRRSMTTYALITFGCQMNQHDSERMAEVLDDAGYRRVEAVDEADVVVLNTCSVRDKAEQKLRSEVGRLALQKRNRPGMIIVVAGCVAQQEGERLISQVRDIDVVLGPDNIPELPALLADIELGGVPKVCTSFDVGAPRFLRAKPRQGQVAPATYVTIMKGCDERCSFCIVPTTRGPERYRPSGDTLSEIAMLVRAGVREVTLLGQTVNSYRDPSEALPRTPETGEPPWKHTRTSAAREDESEFAALLRAIATQIPELGRLRYTSPHPRHLTVSLIEAHKDCRQLARHVHMPVQSGSDAVLRRMIRRYSRAEYVERCERLCAEVPGMTLSTDVIVGFPGETRRDFEDTLSLVEEIGFVGIFGFKYSPRPKTPALRLGDDVPEEEKSARLTELFQLSEQLRQRHLSGLVGSTQSVLLDGYGKDGRIEGRTERNEIVHLSAPPSAVGQLVEVTITAAYKNSLEGRVSAEFPHSLAATVPGTAGTGEGRVSSTAPFPV